MSRTLTDYKGLQLPSPQASNRGGLAIQENFTKTVDWNPPSVWDASTDPGATDDIDAGYYPGSRWLNTLTSKIWTCVDNTPGAAVWQVSASGFSIGTIGITIDAGGPVIPSGVKGYFVCPFAGTLNSYSLTGDVSGSISIDVWKIASGTALPTVTNTITGANYCVLSSAVAATNVALTSWTGTAVTAFDIFGFNVTGTATNITKATLVLKVTKA